MQKAGALSQILGNVAEHAKEFCFAGNQSHPAVRLLRNFACKIASTISLRLSERQISAVFVAYWEDFDRKLTCQRRAQAGLHTGPFRIQNAEVNRIALPAVIRQHVLAQRPFLFSAQTKDSLPRALVQRVSLEFDAKALPNFECMGEHQ